MSNEFIIRKGFKSLSNSEITGSLNVTTQPVTISGSTDGSLLLYSYLNSSSITLTDRTNNQSTYIGLTTPLGGGPDLSIGTNADRIIFNPNYAVRFNTPNIEFASDFNVNLSGNSFFVAGARNIQLRTIVNDIDILKGGYNTDTYLNSYTGYNIVINNSGSANQGDGKLLIGTAIDSGFRLDVSGSGRFMSDLNVTGSTKLSGSLIVTGSISSTLGFTGSVLGTASYANNALSSSYAGTASILLGSVVSASYALTASYVLNNGSGLTQMQVEGLI